MGSQYKVLKVLYQNYPEPVLLPVVVQVSERLVYGLGPYRKKLQLYGSGDHQKVRGTGHNRHEFL